MSVFTIFQIAAQGMSAQRERLEAATSNLANAHTTRTAEGGPYRRRDVVFEATAIQAPPSSFNTALESLFPQGSLFSGASAAPQGVQASTRLASADQIIKRYQPDHPDADANGYVALPEVDALEETVNMLSASRSFDANATAFNTAKEMARASLRLGEG
jgi:flagellar basal-body rod protein FlgC